MPKKGDKTKGQKQSIVKASKERLPSEEFTPLSPEVLKDIPPAQQKQIISSIRQSFSFLGTFGNPLLHKITSEHISEIIRCTDTQDERDRAERKGERKHNTNILIIVLIFVIFLVVFLVLLGQKEILPSIISAILAFGGGFGVGRYFEKK